MNPVLITPYTSVLSPNPDICSTSHRHQLTFGFRKYIHVTCYDQWSFFLPIPLSRRGPEPPTFPALLSLLIAACSHWTATSLLGKELSRINFDKNTRKTQYNHCLLEDLANPPMLDLKLLSLDVPSFCQRLIK